MIQTSPARLPYREQDEVEVIGRLSRLASRFGIEPGVPVEYWRGIGMWGEGGEYLAYTTQHWTHLGAEWHRRVAPFKGFPGHPKWTVAETKDSPAITKIVWWIDWYRAVTDQLRNLRRAVRHGDGWEWK